MRQLYRSALICFLAVTPGLAAGTQEPIQISCADAPKDAVLTLPEPLSRWAKVRCTVFGHTLTASDRWFWSYPGGFRPAHFPAQMVRREPKQLRHQAYFKSVNFEKLEGAEASAANEKIANRLSAKPEPIESAYRLTLTSNNGGTHVVFFVRTEHEAQDGKGLWGFACTPGCADGEPFMLFNEEGKR